MTKWLRSGQARELVFGFAAGATLLLASLANFLTYNGYPIMRTEVGLASLGLLAVCAAMAPLYVGQRRWGRSFLEGLLIVLFIDLNTESLTLALAVGLAVGVITWWRRFSLIEPMAVLGFVVLATTLIGLGEAPNWIRVQKGSERGGIAAAARKPAIVHIILDEHIGLDGLQNEGAEGRRVSDELRAYYLGSGFAVYGGAYSQHFNTVAAIPDVLNYGRRLGQEATKRGLTTGPTEHLMALTNQGYWLTILQSNFVDYCTNARFYECITYDASSLRPTLHAPLATRARLQLIVRKFLSLSDIFGGAAESWNLGALLLRRAGVSVPFYDNDLGRSSTVGALEAVDTLAERLKSARPGDVIFAHLLLPHYPYVVRRTCSYLPWEAWEERVSRSSIETRRRAYDEQLRCTTKKLGTILQSFSQSPTGKNAVIIIHGDHGSRITRSNPNAANFGRISDEDMIAGFTTFFAVRAPGLQPGYFKERQPISALLRDFAASGFRSAPHPKPPQTPAVYLADSNWKPVRRVALPSSWTNAR